MTVRELKALLQGVPDDMDVTLYIPLTAKDLFPGEECDLTHASTADDGDGEQVFRLTSEQFTG